MISYGAFPPDAQAPRNAPNDLVSKPFLFSDQPSHISPSHIRRRQKGPTLMIDQVQKAHSVDASSDHFAEPILKSRR